MISSALSLPSVATVRLNGWKYEPSGPGGLQSHALEPRLHELGRERVSPRPDQPSLRQIVRQEEEVGPRSSLRMESFCGARSCATSDCKTSNDRAIAVPVRTFITFLLTVTVMIDSPGVYRPANCATV